MPEHRIPPQSATADGSDRMAAQRRASRRRTGAMPVMAVWIGMAASIAIIAMPSAASPQAASPQIASPQVAPAPTRDGAACEVWRREQGFARSVMDHDAAAFAAFLADDVVFDAATSRPLRGAPAVVEAWTELVRGDGIALAWYPRHVNANGEHPGALAWSSGPYLLTRERDGRKVARIGTFHSIWRRDADGVWRVLMDAGDGGGAREASPADIEAFHRDRGEACGAG